MANKNTDPRFGRVKTKTLQNENNFEDDSKESLSKAFNYNYTQEAMGVGSASQEYTPEELGVMSGIGSSHWDQDSYNMNELKNAQDIRANNQPGIIQVGNGILKGAVLAGTTFIDGTIGLLWGGMSAIDYAWNDKGDPWSQLWDNEVSNAMKSINELSEEYLPNYYTEAEQNEPFWKHIFSANFLGDKFLKNLGFTIGAFYSGGLEAGLVRSVGKGITRGIAGTILKNGVKAAKIAEDGSQALSVANTMRRVKNVLGTGNKITSVAASAIGSVTSAVNEGRIEALNNSSDWFNLQKQKIGDMYERGEITEEQAEELLARASEDRLHMGNMDLLMNLPILTLSNVIQFGKLYGHGINNAKKAFNIKGTKGNYAAGTTKRGIVWDITKGGLSEGAEEMAQKMASTASGNYYETDLNNFIKAKTDPNATQETLSWTKAIASAINENLNDSSSWEEFTIGALTGFLGMPTFRSARSKTGGWQSPISIKEGAFNNWRESMARRAEEQQIADYLNSRVQSKDYLNYFQGLSRHSFYESKKTQALENNDDFNYHNADHAQMLSDIMMFDKAGKLDDYIDMINEAYDTSDENLESIVKNTTKKLENGKYDGPYVDTEGNPKYSTPEGKEEMIKDITDNRDKLIQEVRRYSAIKEEIETNLPDQASLSDDQMEELVWLRSQIDNWTGRAETMSGEVRSAIQSVVGDLTSLKDTISSIKTKSGQEGVMREVEKTDDKGNKYTVKEYDASLSPVYTQMEEYEKQLQDSIDLLSSIAQNDDKRLPLVLASSKETTKAIIDEIKDLDEEVMPKEKKDEVVKKINDILKINDAKEKYREKYNEYVNNPQKQLADQNKAKEQNAKNEVKLNQSKILERFDFSKPASEIAITLDNNMDDIDENGGLDKFLRDLTPKQRSKVKAAILLTKGKNGLKRLLNNSSLRDDQKKILQAFIDDKTIGVDSLDELIDAVKDGLEKGEIKDALLESLNKKDGEIIDESAVAAVEQMEAATRDFLSDENLKGLLKAQVEQEKALDAITDEDLKHISKMKKSEEERETGRVPEEEEELGPTPKEGELGPVPNEKDKNPRGIPKEPKESDEADFDTTDGLDKVDKENPTNPAKKENSKGKNKNTAKGIKLGTAMSSSKKWNLRPQLSEYYLNGYDLQTYLDYITKHPEAIPEGVDKDKYLAYIEETHKYLKEHGAFDYVNTQLKAGQEIEFTVDEELNTKAKTTVILMRVKDPVTNEYQVIGSLPTSLDLDSRTVITTDLEGNPIERKVNDKTYGENNPEIKELVDSLLDEYNHREKSNAEIEALSSYEKETIERVDKIVKGNLSKLREARVAEHLDATGKPKSPLLSDIAHLTNEMWRNWGKKIPNDKSSFGFEMAIDALASKGDITRDNVREKLENLFKEWGFKKVWNKIDNLTDVNTLLSKIVSLSNSYKKQEKRKKEQGTLIFEDELVIKGQAGGLGTEVHWGPNTDISRRVKDPRGKAREKGINEPFFDGNVLYMPANKGILKATGRDDWESITFPRGLNEEEQQAVVKTINEFLNSGSTSWKMFARKIVDAVNAPMIEKLVKNTSTALKNANIASDSASNIVSEILQKQAKELGVSKEDIVSNDDIDLLAGHILTKPNITINRKDNQWASNEKREVKELMGGNLPLSATDRTIAQAYEGTDETPIIAVVNKQGIISRFKDGLDTPLMQIDGAIHGQVYAMIPTNKGNFLPLLLYSTPLNELSDNDWYIQQIIDTIQSMLEDPRSIQGISRELYKMFRVPGIAASIGNTENGKWVKTDSALNAANLRISFTNPNNEDKPSVRHIPIVDGKIDRDAVLKAIRSILKDYPNITTNVDITKLGNSPDDVEYRKNISRYLSANMIPGQTRAINNWFTFTKGKGADTTNKEEEGKKGVLEEKKVEEKVVKNEKNVQKKVQNINVGGKGYTINGEEVTADDGHLVTDAEAKKVQEEAAKKDSIQINSMETIDMGSVKGSPKEAESSMSFFSVGNNAIDPGSTFSNPKPSSKFFSKGRRKYRETTSESGEVWNQEEEMSILNAMLPQLSRDNRVRFVEGLINAVEKGKKAWGMTVNGIITLSDLAAPGTTYHEAFHVVFNNILNENEQKALLKEAKSRFGKNLTNVEAEERLAEEFREYVQKRGVGKRSLGRRILDFFKSLFTKVRYWNKVGIYSDTLYETIRTGGYANRTINNTISSRTREEELTQEMKDILAKAPRNAEGKLLAPNGKVSNLTERQYAQVRTKAFKEWFGDWEKLAESKQVEINFKEALENFETSNSNVDKKSIALSNLNPNQKSDEQVLLDAGYIKIGNLFVSPNFNKEILSIIPTQLLSIMEKSGIRILSFGQGDYSAMSGGVKINGHSVGEIRFTKDNDAERIAHNILHEIGHYLYSHYLNENDKSTALVYNNPISIYVQNLIDNTRTSGASIGEENFVEGFATYFHNKIFGNRSLATNIEGHLVNLYRNLYSEFGIDNNVSKVVDENGEPKVMYHTTPWGKFNSFKSFSPNTGDRTMPGRFYFGTNEAMVRRYARGEFNKGKETPHTYEVFLNIRNPFRSTEDAITLEEGLLQLDKLKDVLSKSEYSGLVNTIEKSYNMEYDKSRFTTSKVYDAIAKYFKETSTSARFDTITNATLSNNMQDGMFYPTRNEIEGKEKEDFDALTNKQVWAINPNQIKSATDNVGTFDSNNPDIRYRVVEESSEPILSANEYANMLDELDISEDSASTFLDNFLNKVLRVSPRNKVDIHSKGFIETSLARGPRIIEGAEKPLSSLVKRVLGYSVYTDVDMMSREEFEKEIRNELQNWGERLVTIINDGIPSTYTLNIIKEYDAQEQNIRKLKEELTSTKDPKDRSAIGFKLHKAYKKLSDIRKSVQESKVRDWAKLLAAKNRLIALNTIPNLKEIALNRIMREYDSLTLTEEEFAKKVEPLRPLSDALYRASRSSRHFLDGAILFSENEQRASNIDEVEKEILKNNPEFGPLLKMIKSVNPNVSIVLGANDFLDKEVSPSASGAFEPKTNTIYYRRNADVYTYVHELVHAATVYSLFNIKNGEREFNEFYNKIEDFMNYVRDYIDRVGLDATRFTIHDSGFTALGNGPRIYGFTDPMEFLSEVFANPGMQELLSNIPAMEGKKFKSILHQIWNNIIEFLKRFSKNTNVHDKNALEQAKKLGYVAMMLQQQHMSAIMEKLASLNSEEQNSTEETVRMRNVIADMTAPIDTKAVQKVFTGLNINDVNKFVRGLGRIVALKNSPVSTYNKFKKGVLFISETNPNGVDFQPSFHYIVDVLMTEGEKNRMFAMAERKYGVSEQMELEEKMAKDFRDFINGRSGTTLDTLRMPFEGLKRIVKSIEDKTYSLDNLFYSLYSDNFYKMDNERDTDTYDSDYLKYKSDKFAYDNLDNELKEDLRSAKISRVEYERLNVDDKETIIMCML